MLAQPSGTVYANGEFTIGIAPRALPRDQVAVSSAEYSREEEFRTSALSEFGSEALLEFFPVEAPLGSSSVPISHTRKRKGLNGITGNGRRSLRVGCHLLEELRSHHKIGFFTATLPEMTITDRVNVHLHWSEIVRTFTQWLGRRLKKKGIPEEYCYVTEIQTQRLKRDGKPYYHLHLCYPCAGVADYKWYIPATDFRVAWERVVSAFCVSSYHFGASIDAVVVKKSVGAYLGKYLSKGGGNVEAARNSGLPLEAVGHWWGWSSRLRKRARKRELRATPMVEWLWRELPALAAAGHIKWMRYIYIDTHLNGPRCVGVAGCLDRDTLYHLHCTYRATRGHPK